jgi:hypothetical protein
MSNLLDYFLYLLYFNRPMARLTGTPLLGTKPAFLMVTINFVEVRRCVLQELP